MDIFRFINSSDIRKYLKHIEYDFNQNEIAWLIYQCNSISFDEKKTSWDQLIHSYEDADLQKRCKLQGCSLFQAIKKFMQLKEMNYHQFLLDESKAIYSYEFYCPGDVSYCEEFSTKYSSYKKCWDAIATDFDLGMTKIIIRKEFIDYEKGKIEVEYKQDEKANWVVYDITSYNLNEEEGHVDSFFEEMFFEFPTPFDDGDIVHIPRIDNPYYEEKDSAFVFEEILNHTNMNAYWEYADNSDMRVYGHYVNQEGDVVYEGGGNYMDLEYYPLPLEGNQRILKAISQFKKEKIDLSLLLIICKKCWIENISKEYITGMYSGDILKKLGL